MKNRKIVYKSAIIWKDQMCDIEHYVASDFSHLPDEHIKKAHGVCFCDGKLLVVYHKKWDIWGIPGGTREKGENINETLAREIREESNCSILDRTPIAYQKIIHNDGSYFYALFYYCNVDIEGDFVDDIDGSITEIEWINPEHHSHYLEKKPFRKIVIENAFSKKKS